MNSETRTPTADERDQNRLLHTLTAISSFVNLVLLRNLNLYPV